MNTNVRDTRDAYENLRSELDALSGATIDQISAYFEDANSAAESLYSEIEYLCDEFEEQDSELVEWHALFGSLNEAFDAKAKLDEAQFTAADKAAYNQTIEAREAQIEELVKANDALEDTITDLKRQLADYNEAVERAMRNDRRVAAARGVLNEYE